MAFNCFLGFIPKIGDFSKLNQQINSENSDTARINLSSKIVIYGEAVPEAGPRIGSLDVDRVGPWIPRFS
jgi:hypothetical protein